MGAARTSTAKRKGRGGARLGAGRKPTSALAKAQQLAKQQREASYLATLEKRARERLQAETAGNEKLLEEYRELGEAPEDPLSAVEYAFRMLSRSLKETVADKTLTARERRHEMRLISKAMVPLLPAQRMLEAERVVREAAEVVKSDRPDPAVEDVSPDDEPLQME